MLRFEHIEWDLSTPACDAIQHAIEEYLTRIKSREATKRTRDELANCVNELRSRLQRTDQDPHAEAAAQREADRRFGQPHYGHDETDDPLLA